MHEIYDLSASEILRQIKSKKLSVTEVSSAFIGRIESINPIINAINQVDPEKILNQAKNLDKYDSNKRFKILHGLPITIKDTFYIKGFRPSKGSPGLLKNTADYDASVVKRLKTAGCIILGLTNTSELLLSYETDNLIYGRTSNPYDLSRTPGGSSGGEAAIIAGGGSPLGIGSDAGGSIRQPAHYCGICGHKPTNGFVPLTGTFPCDGIGIASQLVSIGPMSRFVEDIILTMNIITGSDNLDPHAPPIHFKKVSRNIKSLRVAYFDVNPTGAPPCDDTLRILNQTVKILEEEGCHVVKDYPLVLNEVYKLHFETFILGGDGGETLRNLLNDLNTGSISALTQQFLMLASKCTFSSAQFRKRLVDVEKFRYAMMNYMQKYDVILSPVCASPARLHMDTYPNIKD